MIRIVALSLFLLAAVATPVLAQQSGEITAQKQAEADAKAAVAALQRIAMENGWRNDAFYQTLNETSAQGVDAVRNAIATGIANGGVNERAVAVQWLVDHTFGLAEKAKFNSLYYLFLADLENSQAQFALAMGRMDDYNRAAFTGLRALMTYELVALADAERGDDPSVTAAVNDDVTKRYADMRYAFKIPGKEEYDVASFEAVDTEGRNNDRPVNLALCRSGEKGKADPNYTPKPIDDWVKKRIALRVQYKNLWSEQFYLMRGDKKPSTNAP